MTQALDAGVFAALSPEARLNDVIEATGLSDASAAQLREPSNLAPDVANHMIENMISTIAIPVGVATGMIVDGRERLVPLAIEETSIVGFVSDAAARCRAAGGFSTSMSGTVMIAQVQVLDVANPHAARLEILAREEEIRALCDGCDSVLLEHGGGFRGLEVRLVESTQGTMLLLHLLVDTRDAMGANTVNTMAERLAPRIEEWTKGTVLLRILSNLADRRLSRARATWRVEDIGGAQVRDAMVSASALAAADPYRAATNNKGIMNGISAVVLATGNDTRAVEAGAHAFAARGGSYRSLSHWEVGPEGNLSGAIELPMAVGTVGGATRAHPTARALLELMQVSGAEELGRLIAAVGLAQNFAALHALCTDGIQKGHMARHAANVAMEAGAAGPEVDAVVAAMAKGGTISASAAREALRSHRKEA